MGVFLDRLEGWVAFARELFHFGYEDVGLLVFAGYLVFEFLELHL